MKLLRIRFLMFGLAATAVIASAAQVLHRHGLNLAMSQSFNELMEQSMQAMHKDMHAAAGPGTNDEVFVRMMIPHHEGAVEMARAILLYGKDREIQRLAKAIVAEQEYEIQLMRIWLDRNASRSTAAPSQESLEVSR